MVLLLPSPFVGYPAREGTVALFLFILGSDAELVPPLLLTTFSFFVQKAYQGFVIRPFPDFLGRPLSSTTKEGFPFRSSPHFFYL